MVGLEAKIAKETLPKALAILETRISDKTVPGLLSVLEARISGKTIPGALAGLKAKINGLDAKVNGKLRLSDYWSKSIIYKIVSRNKQYMNIYVFKTLARALCVRADLQRAKTTVFVNVSVDQMLTRLLRMPPLRLMYATMEHHFLL